MSRELFNDVIVGHDSVTEIGEDLRGFAFSFKDHPDPFPFGLKEQLGQSKGSFSHVIAGVIRVCA